MTKICSKEDVQSYLTAAMVENKKVIVWTKSESDEEFFYSEAIVSKINSGKEIRLELDKTIPGIIGQAIFLAIKEDSFVMVSKIANLNEKKILVALPSMATGKERRRSPRKRFKLEEKKEITVTLATTHELLITHVLDLSQHGMCIAMSKESLQKIIKTKLVHVTQSGGLAIKGKCEMKSLRLLTGAKYNLSPMYSVGFEFVS